MLVKKIMIILSMLTCFMAPGVCMAGLMDYPRVALFPVTNQAANMRVRVGEGEMNDIRTKVDIDLKSFGGFDMLERPDIDKVLTEQEFSHSAIVDPGSAAKLGKILGAQYIVLGTITGLSTDPSSHETIAHLTLRMIEVETARIVLAGMGKGKSKAGISEALDSASEDVLHGNRGMITLLHGKKPSVRKRKNA